LTASSSLGQLLAEVFPSLFLVPSPIPDCWISRFARVDPSAPQIASLSAAIDVVRRQAQLAPLRARLIDEHPTKRQHQEQYDQQVINCLTEACAFAWADLCQLGRANFDYREGAPDVYVEQATWVEAKSINPSQADRALTRHMAKTGAVISGDVPSIGPGLLSKFQYSYEDARRKFARQGQGRYFVFFNLTQLDMNLWPRTQEILEMLVNWAEAQVEHDPSIGITMTYAYDWQHPFVSARL
jgi:hypothetical protein